jgi:hypothetical protein
LNRGSFGSLLNLDPYQEATKDWYVHLDYVHIFWYDLIVNSPDKFDSKKIIFSFLKNLKLTVEENLEKRFIYFICSRKRVRFSTKRKPKYSVLLEKFKIYIEIGKEREESHIFLPLFDREITSEIKITEKFIIFKKSDGSTITCSIHDLLLNFNISVGFDTQIHYVGYTKNPDSRPINGSHSGLSDVLYNVSNEDNDIFICFNLFKVISNSTSSSYNFQFVIANSMIDEVKADLEGRIIEKCLILYFDANNQMKNKEKEKIELKNNLIKLSLENSIHSIHFLYELEQENEYYRFSSSNVAGAHKHFFTAKLDCEEPVIYKDSNLFSEIVKENL